MDATTLESLKAASDGLLYPSETDAPIETFQWGAAGASVSVDRIRALAGHQPDAPIEEEGLDEFLAPLLADRSLEGRGRKLKETLERSLADIRIFRIGRISIDVFVVGKTKGGEWAGVKTRVVET
jgi:hypothetical protein